MQSNQNTEKNKRILQVIFHVGFLAILVGVILTIWFKFSNFINGTVISDEDFNFVADDAPYTESLDFILPLIVSEENLPEDDGETVIVCFGNNPFSDDRDSENNIANLIAQETDATVYNCAVPGSYLAANLTSFYPEQDPMDAFSFYWLTTTFCLDNFYIFDRAFQAMDNPHADIIEAAGILEGIDFSKVDVITIMYDGSDYLAGRRISNPDNATDIQTFTGALTAGISLIQETYPHIRIVVMSPTYAFAVKEDGTYTSSDIWENGWGYLSTYVSLQGNAIYDLSVSFVDHLYGTIHEDIAQDYLIDNLHLNEEGRKLVAQRFVDAINTYPTPVVR